MLAPALDSNTLVLPYGKILSHFGSGIGTAPSAQDLIQAPLH